MRITTITCKVVFPLGTTDALDTADAINGTRRRLLHFSDAFIKTNQDFFHEYPDSPGVYDVDANGNSLSYEGQDPAEAWLDYPTLRLAKKGDCEDLVNALVAEYRYRYDIPAKPWVSYRRQRNGSYLYHFRCWLPNLDFTLCPVKVGPGGRDVFSRCDDGGFLEDISIALGMP